MNLTKFLAALLLVLALGLGLGAWMLSRKPARPAPLPVETSQSSARERAEQHPVVVTAKAVAAGQRLASDDLKVVQMPTAIAGSFSATEELMERTTVMALAADAPLFEQHLINGLALQISQGERAVSIGIKESMAAGHHVRPGDFVDVFFTLDNTDEQTSVDTQTRLLLARSRVLAYGPASVEAPPPTAEQRKAEEEANSKPANRRTSSSQAQANRPLNTAVLAVPLEDVERLTLAEKYGQLTLALRHPDDVAVPDASLFAQLPTALQPVAGRLGKNRELQGVDRAYAGLRFKDLATGAESKATPRARPAPAQRAAQEPRQRSVEMHQGATVQTVRY